MYATKYKLENAINTAINIKEKLINQFERMAGAAIREGYWDAEDYKNEGDIHEITFNSIDYSTFD